MELRTVVKCLILIAGLLALGEMAAFAQLGAPEVQGVYGGRVSWIDAVTKGGSETRVFVSTESANSLFYADVNHTSSPVSFGNFRVVPDLDDSAGYGVINGFAVDQASGWAFPIHESGLLGCWTNAGSLTTIETGRVSSVFAYDHWLFYIEENEMWTYPNSLNGNAPTDGADDLYPAVAGGGAGNWIAVWHSTNSLGGTVGADYDVLFARSEDNGLTWSAPAALNSNAATDTGQDENPQVLSDGTGTWVAVWFSSDSLGGTLTYNWDIFVARSTDDGLTWSAPAALNTNAVTDAGSDMYPRLTTDGMGNWVAVWFSDETMGTLGSDRDILVAHSTDNGQTWVGLGAVNTNAPADVDADEYPQIATDGTGNWVTVWYSSDTLGGTISNDWDILVARSKDNGQTWSAPAPLNGNASMDWGNDFDPELTTDGNGVWVAVWWSHDSLGGAIGSDSDILVAFSEDDGQTWSPPMALNANAATDSGSDLDARIATDGADHWVTVWHSEDTLGGTISNDYDILFTRFPDSELHFGWVDSVSGVFNEDTNSPLPLSFGGTIQHNPSNDLLYIFAPGSAIYKSSDVFNGFDAATTFSPVSLPGPAPDWEAFGIGPDGRLFVGGRTGVEPNHYKSIAYTDNESTWTQFNTGIGGTAGNNIETGPNPDNYEVYYGTAASDDKGQAGTWSAFPRGGTFETHANDGCVRVDPSNTNVVYITTDQGIGASTNRGVDIFGIDDGVTAVQVWDFDMDATKDIAWAASKSGIRRATNYSASPVWSSAMFPMDDGSPYYSVDAPSNDTSGLVAYAGNVRVYKTTDGGSSWSQVFTAENPPYSFGFWIGVAALEVDPYDTNRVFAGYIDMTESEGGLFVTEDSGSNWSQITNAPIPSDGIDVNDIAIVQEGSTTVVYAAVSYDLGSPSGWGVYQITGNGASGWSVTHDMSSFVVTVRDLALDSTGGVYACGTDAGANEPHVYYKAPGGAWTALTVSGFPQDAEGRAVTVGLDTLGREIPYVAVGTEVFCLPSGGSAWVSVCSYPAGTQINVVYWDDLMVGTGTGLYGYELLDTFDSDGDGLSDADETNVYGTDPQKADTDGDGLSDGGEIICRTNPTNSASVLRMTEGLPLSNGVFRVSWDSVEGITYTVAWKRTLTDAVWRVLGSVPAATGTVQSVCLDHTVTNAPSRFYRIAVPVP